MFYPLLLTQLLLVLANVRGQQNGTAETTTPLPVTTPAGHAARPTVGMGQLMSGQQKVPFCGGSFCYMLQGNESSSRMGATTAATTRSMELFNSPKFRQDKDRANFGSDKAYWILANPLSGNKVRIGHIGAVNVMPKAEQILEICRKELWKEGVLNEDFDIELVIEGNAIILPSLPPGSSPRWAAAKVSRALPWARTCITSKM